MKDQATIKLQEVLRLMQCMRCANKDTHNILKSQIIQELSMQIKNSYLDKWRKEQRTQKVRE